MLELTIRTVLLVNRLFQECNRQDVIELLKCEGANNLASYKNATPDDMERIRFAAIKLSEGNLDKLYYAVDLANKDWRDLLVFSDFANDINAHEVWADTVLDMNRH